ncbi:hypothetical protein JCM16358_10950 [Halanaerocella petrolearia]
MNILLVDPVYIKYPNLALMKISTYHKKKGNKVFYQQGFSKQKVDPEIIYVSALFTYKANKTIKVINKYQKSYPKAEIKIGGIYPSLMPEHVEKNTGIKPHIGLWEKIELLPPDYSLFSDHKYSDTSYVFTTRGCRNNCDFCAVNELEPEYKENQSWIDHIDFDKPNITVYDNNLTTSRFEHFKMVMDKLNEVGKKVCFDNGFDCRYLTKEHAELIGKLRLKRRGVRLAFDDMSQDGKIQKAVKILRNNGVAKSNIMVYVLFNFKDDLEEALYRANEIKKLNVRVYPQRYVPLDWTKPQSYYVSDAWDKDMVREFRFYWMMYGVYSKMSFEKFIEIGGEKEIAS